MANFKIIKRGYSQLEVDDYINKLKNDYETRISEQNDRIFYLKDEIEKITKSSDNELMTSLVSAVEKAKLIENSSKNIYELETKKLNLLYTKMENLLKDENIYNDRSIKQELLSLIQDCRNSLQNNIAMQTKNIQANSSGDPVKRLLSKMIGFNKISTNFLPIVPSVPAPNKAVQKNSSQGSKCQEQRGVGNKKSEVKSSEKIESNEFNQFLNIEKTQNSQNFENIMFAQNKAQTEFDLTPNESGFDLKEAINPKEDLEEIMKAFDFFNEIEEESQKKGKKHRK